MSPLRPAAAVLALLGVTGCGADTGSGGGSQARTVTVFAAASLTATFTELAEDFEADQEGVRSS